MELPTANIDDRIQDGLESIADCTKTATEAVDELFSSETSLTPQGTNEKRKGDSKWFRRYLLDMYSILDFVWHLLYGCFSTDRQRRVGFPYKPTGVKIPQDPKHPNHDGRGKYLKDTFKDWDMLTTTQRKEVGDIILSVQPIQEVNGCGDLVGQLQYQPCDKEVFAILHSCRNWEAHKGSIHVYSKDSFVEVCQRKRTIRLVAGTTDQKRDCIYIALDKSLLWVKMPETLSPSIGSHDRPVMALTGQFHKTVTSIADRLLHSTNILPQDETIWKQVCSE